MDPRRNGLAREIKAMTRAEVIQKAIEGRIDWLQAASICRVTDRHMRRLRERYERLGMPGLRDGRCGKHQPRQVSVATVEKICRLKRDVYPDFSVQHFHQFATERHGIEVSYTWTRLILQAHGLVEPAPGRGKYRRRRERRPMVGMLLHLDASTHQWLPNLPARDLVLALDDADGRALYGRFVEQEGTLSTLQALRHILERFGRFCELYSDRGSHFARTAEAGQGPDPEQHGQVARALRSLGIRQILARSPQARGRSERAFGTVQGRLPQELRLAGVTNYEAANRYLERRFLSDFNRRFTVKPAQPDSAFLPVAGIDLDLVLSIQHERTVRNDNTVSYLHRVLQLPPTAERTHYVRCLVLVHEFTDGTLGVSYQGRLLARYTSDGEQLPLPRRRVA